MQVHKFGGASVRSADALRNVSNLLKTQSSPALLVMSAMGKMTNALEAVVNAAHSGSNDVKAAKAHFLNFHLEVVKGLGIDGDASLMLALAKLEEQLGEALGLAGSLSYHQLYDAIVPMGELYSTCIASHFLKQAGHAIQLLDARELVHTDDTYREARVDWEQTTEAISRFGAAAKDQFYLVQGFIGSSPQGNTTTLGREGSDFTAAIFASSLKASSVTLWKDVTGVYSADPKLYPQAEQIDRLTYIEALEMANYGAKVIHPKTLKPLENNGIPLYVRSFQEPEASGTVISQQATENYPPVIVKVPDLVLLRLQLKDLSYITDVHLLALFDLFRDMRIKVYMMQTGFITLSAGISIGREKMEKLIDALAGLFSVRSTTDLELLTVRHYRAPELEQLINGREIFLEQRSLKTVQLLLAAEASE